MKILRRLLPAIIAVACFGTAVLTFDWSAILRGLTNMRWIFFIAATVPLTLVTILAGGVRWVSVSGLPFNRGTLWRAYCYVGVAIAAAIVTPFQLGEAIKLNFARRDGLQFGRSGLAYAMERVCDVAVLAAMLAVGLTAHDGRGWSAGVVAVLIVAMIPTMPLIAGWLATLPMPKPLTAFLAPLREATLSPQRFAMLIICTLVKWAGTIMLWAVTLESVDMHIPIVEVTLLVSVVTFAGTFSLIPGGIGVAEVSAKAVLVWVGVEAPAAETAAIALRLLTPVVMLVGGIHALGIARRVGSAPAPAVK